VSLGKKNPAFRRILLLSSSASSSISRLFDLEVKSNMILRNVGSTLLVGTPYKPRKKKLNLQQHRCKNGKLPINSIFYKLRDLRTPNQRRQKGLNFNQKLLLLSDQRLSLLRVKKFKSLPVI